MWCWQAAIDDINANGGIEVAEYGTKIPIEVIIADHAADESKAVTQAEWLCQQGVVAILASSAAVPGAEAVAEKNKIPLIMTGGMLRQPHDQGYTYLFTYFVLNDADATATAEFVAALPADQQPTVIGNMVGQDSFGQELGMYLEQDLTALGYQVVNLPYTRFTTDLSSQVLEMKNANVDYVVGGVLPTDAALLMKTMKQLDLSPKGMILEAGPDDPGFWGSLGGDGDYVCTLANFDSSFTYPGAAELSERYTAKFNEPVFESAGPAYADVQILAAAIESAGTLDPQQIRDAIAATDMMTVAGPAKFNENGTSILTGVIQQWQSGKTVVVWPEDAATGQLIYPMPAWGAR